MCVDPQTRRVAWKTAVPNALHLLAAGGGLYLRGHDVRALDSATGRTVWTRPAEGCGAMTLADGLLHFADARASGRLVALDARTGRTAWEMPGLRSCDALVTAGGTGYLKTQDGVIYALALAGPGPS